MGLENLKSIFSEVNKPSLSVEGNRHSFPTHQSTHSNLDELQSNVVSDVSIMPTPVIDTILQSTSLIDSDLPNYEDDVRFTAGLGWPLANNILKTTQNGNSLDLFYINSQLGDVIAASGALTNFGKAEDFLSPFGIDLPDVSFSLPIKTSKPIQYLDTVFEASNDTIQDNLLSSLNGITGNKRGVVFQVFDENRGLGDIQPVTKKLMSDGSSFVQLGFAEQASIWDKLGDIQFGDAFPDIDFDLSGLQLPDIGVPSLFNSITSNISLPKFKLPELNFPEFDIDLPEFDINLPKLSMPSVNLPQFNIPGINLPDLDFDFNLPSLNLPNIPLPSLNLPNISLPSLNLPSFGGLPGLGGLPDISGLSNLFSSFPKFNIAISQNMLDVLGAIKDNTSELLKSISDSVSISPTSGNPLGVLKDIKEALAPTPGYTFNGGSVLNNVNPRSLQWKSTETSYVSTPYSNLGDIKYNVLEKIEELQSSLEIGQQGLDDFRKVQNNKIGNYYPSSLGNPITGKNKGDIHTILPIASGNTLSEAGTTGGYSSYDTSVEGEKYGMPFYFKDLRSSPPQYIVFRGYIDSINENLSADWSAVDYIGRSESAWVYEKGNRKITLSFKVAAQTENELQTIYEKVNKLTSMVYPRYVADSNLGGKLRMVPPLTSIRVGELFGNNNRNLNGFIESMDYNFPENSPWETKAGKRVPKMIDITVSYQVIHRELPSHDSKTDEFHGFISSKI